MLLCEAALGQKGGTEKWMINETPAAILKDKYDDPLGSGGWEHMTTT